MPQGAESLQDAGGLPGRLRRGDDRHLVRPGRAQRAEGEIRPVLGGPVLGGPVLGGLSGTGTRDGGTGSSGEDQVVIGQLEAAGPPGP